MTVVFFWKRKRPSGKDEERLQGCFETAPRRGIAPRSLLVEEERAAVQVAWVWIFAVLERRSSRSMP